MACDIFFMPNFEAKCNIFSSDFSYIVAFDNHQQSLSVIGRNHKPATFVINFRIFCGMEMNCEHKFILK